MSLQLSDVSTFPPLFFPVMNEYHGGGAREDYNTQNSMLHVRLLRYNRIGLCVWMIDMVRKAR